MNKKVFTFDMDGTILNSKGQILPETIEALKKAKIKGHLAVLCSGRPYFDMIDIAKKANVFDFLICNNGTYFYDLKTEKFFLKKEVPKSVARDIFEIGLEHETFFALHTINGVYRSQLWSIQPIWALKELKAEWNKFELIDKEEIFEILNKEKITQVSLRATKEIIALLHKYAHKYSDESDIHIAGEVYLDINPKETSKLTGIIDLCKFINMSVIDFITFGDSGNDLQMLRGVGLGIAMGNATPEAKEAATIVIGDHNTNAIAKKIIELI